MLKPLDVEHARSRGWADLSNGKLLAAAEGAGFDILLTVDQNLSFQQSLTGRQIALLTVATRSITLTGLLPAVPKILEAISRLDGTDFHGQSVLVSTF
jgi:Cdc6-like AAA superfamily ATPase